MMKLYRVDKGALHESEGTSFHEAIWIDLIAPSPEEVEGLHKEFDIDLQDIADCLDPNERARVEIEEKYDLLVLRSLLTGDHSHERIQTIPIGVILTPKHEKHFVVIPTRDLRKRIPRGRGKVWHLYLWVFGNKSCYQVRDLSKGERFDTIHRGVRDRRRDFSQWLENWRLLDAYSRGSK